MRGTRETTVSPAKGDNAKDTFTWHCDSMCWEEREAMPDFWDTHQMNRDWDAQCTQTNCSKLVSIRFKVVLLIRETRGSVWLAVVHNFFQLHFPKQFSSNTNFPTLKEASYGWAIPSVFIVVIISAISVLLCPAAVKESCCRDCSIARTYYLCETFLAIQTFNGACLELGAP